MAPPSSSAPLPFTGPWLLAPMEGVTDTCFRDVLLDRHRPEHLGGACTEFIRVTDRGLQAAHIRSHLGARRHPIPVGVQLMGSDHEALAATVRAVLETDAPLIDLNFGCPAKGALRGRAGAAVLQDPANLEQLVRTCVTAAEGRLPITAKIRAGWDDAQHVEDLAHATENAGAAMLTIHCRTRAEQFTPQVDWSRIQRAVEAVHIPVCGNGGVQDHGDLQRMREETGCAYVMVGHAALEDPWVFSGERVSRQQAAHFLLDYARALGECGAGPPKVVARLKQLLRRWRAGSLIAGDADRQTWMVEQDASRVLERLTQAAAAPAPPSSAQLPDSL